MNPDTGTIYRTQHEIDAAALRGERLEYLDKTTARAIETALNRHERRKRAKLARQAARHVRPKRA